MTSVILGLFLALQGPEPVTPSTVPPTASVAIDIEVFSDFHCPFCASFARPFRELQTQGVDGLTPAVRFRHFPLPIHPGAQLAHQAAAAAAEQGRFWEMHDLLFANGQKQQREDFLGYAKQLNLDLPRFARDLDSARIRKPIDADIAEGVTRGVTGTPTFFVNGTPYVGTHSFADLQGMVRGEQRRARALAEITDDLMSEGPANAPITVQLFADLQSPVSATALAVLRQVMKRYPSAIRLQFRNFPLAFHPQAALAHEAAMTAAREGRFWEFATYVVAHQDALREQDLIALAGRLGLDAGRFAQALQEHRYAPRVDADLQAARRLGLRGSPVIVVNGKRFDGVPSLQTLIEHVEAALASLQGIRASGETEGV
jgi:protein-disulfide isomerase